MLFNILQPAGSFDDVLQAPPEVDSSNTNINPNNQNNGPTFGSSQPQDEYLPPNKQQEYLPPTTTAAPLPYLPPSKESYPSYLPPQAQDTYLPPKDEYLPPKSNYLPPQAEQVKHITILEYIC